MSQLRQALVPQTPWRVLQDVLLLGGIALIGLLVLRPAIGLTILWNILIPVAPALLVIVPGIWRNICPLATFSLLPRRFGLSRQKIPPRPVAVALGLLSVALLLLLVPLRHIALNTSGPLSALMLSLAALLAVITGRAFDWRSGWCTSLCPIHPVEKLYGFAPAVTVANARCDSCVNCTVPCPDWTRAMTPIRTAPTRLARWVGDGLTGCFVGLTWGWYQVPDLSPGSDVVAAWLWPLGSAAVSLALYLALKHWFFPSRAARARLVKAFAAAAVTTYYWYRLPALLGFGLAAGNGTLVNLTALLPFWAPYVLRAVTTTFLLWFLLARRAVHASWMQRPPPAVALIAAPRSP